LFDVYPQKLINEGEYLPLFRIAVGINNNEAIVYNGILRREIKTLNWREEKDELLKYINSDKNIKYDVDADNVIGLANNYYINNPGGNTVNFYDNYLTKPNDKFNEWTGNEKEFAAVWD